MTHVDAVGNILLGDDSKNDILGTLSKPKGGSLSAPVQNIRTSSSVQSHSPAVGQDIHVWNRELKSRLTSIYYLHTHPKNLILKRTFILGKMKVMKVQASAWLSELHAHRMHGYPYTCIYLVRSKKAHIYMG